MMLGELGLMPTREGFIVFARDNTKPRGRRGVGKDQYFYKSQKAAAEKYFEELKAKHEGSGYRIVMSECLF